MSEGLNALEHLRLAALDGFACLAERCEEDCCGLWEVLVDDDTLRAWQSLPGAAGEERLAQVETRTDDQGKTASVLMKGQDGRCFFLDPTGLCRIHRDHGAADLPGICREYPRVILENRIRRLETATASCPEIILRIVAGDDPLFAAGPTAAPEEKDFTPDDRERLALFLDDWVLRTLGVSSAPLAHRVFYLASVIGEIYARERPGGQPGELLRTLCGDPCAHLEKISVAAKEMGDKGSPVSQGAFLKTIYNIYDKVGLNIGGTAIDSTYLGKSLAASVGGDDDLAAMYDAFRHCRSEENRYPGDTEPLLERYLRYSLMSRGFPWHPVEQNHVVQLVECLVPYTMIVLVLFALGHHREQAVDRELFAEIVWKIERGVVHTDLVIRDLAANRDRLELQRYAAVFLQF